MFTIVQNDMSAMQHIDAAESCFGFQENIGQFILHAFFVQRKQFLCNFAEISPRRHHQ